MNKVLKAISENAEAAKLLKAEPGDYVKVTYESKFSGNFLEKHGIIVDMAHDENYLYRTTIGQPTEDGIEMVAAITAQDIVKGKHKTIGEVEEITVESFGE